LADRVAVGGAVDHPSKVTHIACRVWADLLVDGGQDGQVGLAAAPVEEAVPVAAADAEASVVLVDHVAVAVDAEAAHPDPRPGWYG
jgi:hypothetical protein